MEEFIEYIKGLKECCEDFSGCGSNREADMQEGKLEVLEEILNYYQENNSYKYISTTTDIKKEIEIINEKIELKEEELHILENNLKQLREKCSHSDLDIEPWDTATCNICGKYFDWYCPTSPTLTCDYEQEDGTYDEDCCRYCGCPEERK